MHVYMKCNISVALLNICNSSHVEFYEGNKVY